MVLITVASKYCLRACRKGSSEEPKCKSNACKWRANKVNGGTINTSYGTKKLTPDLSVRADMPYYARFCTNHITRRIALMDMCHLSKHSGSRLAFDKEYLSANC